MKTRGLWLSWAMVLLWAGCAGPQVPRSALLSDPARWASPAAGSEEAAWSRLLLRGDREGAKGELEVLAGQGSALGRFGLGEVLLLEGRVGEAAQVYAGLLREQASHPAARWGALRLWELREYVPGWPGLAEEAARGALVLPRAERGTRAWAARLRLEARHRQQRASGGEGFFAGDAEGFAQRWRIAGPLSIFPNLDFDVARGELGGLGPLPEALEVEGISHETRSLVLDEPVVDPFFDKAGVYVLESWVSLEGEGRWLVQVESEAGLALEVDGVEVLRRDNRAGFAQARQGAVVELVPGLHRVRVRLAVIAGNEQFFLQWVPEGGQGRVVGHAGAPEGGQVAGGVKVSQGSGGGFFGALTLGEVGEDPLGLWLLGLDEVVNGDPQGASQVLGRLREVAGDGFAGIWFLEGSAARQDPTLGEQARQDRAVARYREAWGRDPGAAWLGDKLGILLLQQQKVEEALPLLESLRGGPMGQEYILHYHLFQALEEKGWAAEARAALGSALERFPGNCTLVELQWGEWQGRDQWPRLESVAKEALACDHSQLQAALHYDLPRGDVARAEGRLRRLASRNPRTTRYLELLAGLLERQGSWEEAGRLREEAGRLAPGRVSQDLLRFDGLLARDRGQAASFLEGRLRVYPGELEFHRAKEMLQGKNVLEEMRLDGKGIMDRYLANPLQTDTHAVYLLDYAATRVYEDGSNLTLTHNIIRVQNKEGIDAFGEVSIPESATLLRIRTVKPDGRSLEPEFIPGKPSISMPNLEAGDFIEYEYVEGREASLLRRGSYQGFRFYFQIGDAPLLRSEYVLEVPAAWDVEVESRNGAPKAEVKEEGGRRRYRFLAQRSGQSVQEPNAVGAVDFLPSVMPGHAYTWVDLYRTYRDRWIGLSRRSELGAQIVASVTGGRGTEEEKARALYRWVKEQIDDDQSGPFAQPAAQVLSGGVGDRLSALSVLLAEAGIEAELVLVRSHAQSPYDGPLPELESWSYPLLRVSLGGAEVWLDPSTPHAPFGSLSPVVQGCDGVTLGARSEGALAGPKPAALFWKTPVLPQGEDLREVSLSLSLDAQGDARGEGVEVYTGSGGAYLRQVVESYSDGEKLRAAFAQSMEESFPGVEVEDLVVEQASDDEVPLVLRYRFVVRGYGRQEGGGLLLDRGIFAQELVAGFAGLPERSTTLAILEPARVKMRVSMVFPQDWEVLEGVKGVDLEQSFGVLRREEVDAGRRNELAFTQLVSIPIQRVEPAKYGDFQRFARAWEEGEKLRVRARPR